MSGGQLVLEQTFQMLGGTLVLDGKTVPIDGGRLSGERIAFTAGDAEYTGTVRGNEMQGEFKSPRGTGPWKAVRSVSR